MIAIYDGNIFLLEAAVVLVRKNIFLLSTKQASLMTGSTEPSPSVSVPGFQCVPIFIGRFGLNLTLKGGIKIAPRHSA